MDAVVRHVAAATPNALHWRGDNFDVKNKDNRAPENALKVEQKQPRSSRSPARRQYRSARPKQMPTTKSRAGKAEAALCEDHPSGAAGGSLDRHTVPAREREAARGGQPEAWENPTPKWRIEEDDNDKEDPTEEEVEKRLAEEDRRP